MIPTEAVVYIPDDIDGDGGLYARQGVAHIERRGNRFVGVLRDWAHVLRLAGEGVVVVFARREHCPPAAEVRSEFVGETTTRLIRIVQEAPADRVDPGPQPRGELYGRAAPFDESPTVAFIDRWRASMKRRNCPAASEAETFPLGDDGGFAERFLEDRRSRRRNARDW